MDLHFTKTNTKCAYHNDSYTDSPEFNFRPAIRLQASMIFLGPSTYPPSLKERHEDLNPEKYILTVRSRECVTSGTNWQ